ncbi:MAG: lysylphosphatidylglycerol synthase domain-containing protein, partial [Chloroflexota bacterium]
FGFSRGSAAVTVQAIFDFLSLAVVGSVAVLRYQQLAIVVLPFTGVLILGVLLFGYAPLILRRPNLPLVAGKRSSEGTGWGNFYQYSRQLLGWKPMLVGLVLGLPTVMVGSLVLFEVAQGYQIPASVGQSAYIYSLSQLAGALSMLPHGLGAIEASSIALFHYAGVDAAFAATAIVLFRLATVGWGLLLGGISLLLLRTPLAGPSVPRP